MKGVVSFLDSHAEAWWPQVFHGAWQAALVTLLVLALVQTANRRLPATLCYALLLVAVAKFMVPPLVALPTGAFSWAEALPEAPGRSVLMAPVLEVNAAVLHDTVPAVTAPSRTPPPEAPRPAAVPVNTTVKPVEALEAPPVPASSPGPAPSPTPYPTWLGVLFALHAAGMAGMALWIAGSTLWLVDQVRRAEPVTAGPAHDVLRAVCATLGVGRKIRLLVGEDDRPPIAFGLLRPTVLLPRNLADQLDTVEARAILAHELAHHRRHDPWAIALENLALLVWWFHPFLWRLIHRLRQTREACCDDVVLSLGVSDGATYCEGLLRTAVSVSGPGRFRMPLGHANALHPLGPRMKRIMDGTLRRSPKLSLAGGLVALAVALVVLPGLRVADAHSTFPIQHEAEEAAAVRTLLQDGLAAWYALEGGAIDLSGNANHGTVEGATPSADRFGRAGRAYAFDGRAGIVIPNSDTLNLRGETALSILAWIKPGRVDRGRQALVEKWGPRMEEDDQYTLALNRHQVEFGLSQESTRIAGGRLRTGAWHLVAGVYDSVAKRIAVYVDGQCVAEKELSFPIRSTNQPVLLGRGEIPGFNFTGIIDDVVISARAFSDEEILRIYQDGAADGVSTVLPAQVATPESPAPPAKADSGWPEVLQRIDRLAGAGPAVFKGKYQHFSRGKQYGEPVEVVLFGVDGGLVGLTDLFGTRHAVTSKRGLWINNYWTAKPGADSTPGYGMHIQCDRDTARVTRRGIREDLDDKHLPVPRGAVFDPNSRPDPYLAAQVFMRRLDLKEGEERTLEVYDWDNQGEGMASYTIWFKHAGKETITVPAGTFETNHIVQQQKSFGDTWFKKRPGHVTDYYILDDGTIIRIYRHREPYELQLYSVEVPTVLPQVEEAAAPQAEEPEAPEVSPPPATPEAAHYFPLKTEGAVVFNGTYGHFAGGQSYGAPGELTVYQAPDGTLMVSASFRGSDYQAVSKQGLATDTYVSGSMLLDGSVQYRSHMSMTAKPGVVARESARLGEDPKREEFPVPEGAVFDPNTRPDPYVVAQIMMRRLNLNPGGERTVEVYDMDNQGDGMAAYTIWFKHMGRETVTVPAGTFDTNHIILQQQTSADTWFKKRAGHVTDFYVLDDGTIVRIYRHREPYEVHLLSMEGGVAKTGQGPPLSPQTASWGIQGTVLDKSQDLSSAKWKAYEQKARELTTVENTDDAKRLLWEHLTARKLLETRASPLAGAVVRIRSETHESQATTDAEGRYAFTNIPTGTYQVSVTATMDSPTGAGPAREISSRKEVRVLKVDHTVDLHLRAEAITVQGRVTDAQGKPLAGVRVCGELVPIRDDEAHGPRRYTITRDDGTYEVVGYQAPLPWEVMEYLSGSSMEGSRGDGFDYHHFYIELSAESAGYVQAAAEKTRLPRATEDLVQPARHILTAFRLAAPVFQPDKEPPPIPEVYLPTSHGNVIVAPDIVLAVNQEPITPVVFPDGPPTLGLEFTPDEDRQQEVEWTDMPVFVSQNDVVYIQASGRMSFHAGHSTDRPGGPNGQGLHDTYQKYFLLSERAFMSLVGRFGLDPIVSDDERTGMYGPGFVGAGIKSTKTTPGAAVLRLGVNDSTGGNTGAYNIRIWVVRGGRTLSSAEAAQAPMVAPVAGAPALEIVAARYGRGNRWQDVTEALRKHASDSGLRVDVVDALGRGPWPNINDAVEVRYREHGVEHTLIVQEGSELVLGDGSRSGRPTAAAAGLPVNDDLMAKAELEISKHYAEAEPEVRDYIRWTAATFGPSGRWLAEDAFDGLDAEAREAKVQTCLQSFGGDYGRHMCESLVAAGVLKDHRLLPGLVSVVTYQREGGQDNRAKWMAAAALGRLGDVSAVPTLIPLVDHYNQNTRLWARASLVRLTGMDLGMDKPAWVAWWNASGKGAPIDADALELASAQSIEKMQHLFPQPMPEARTTSPDPAATMDTREVTPLPLVEDFDDGDFAANPAWTVYNEGSTKGTVEVADGALHIVRRGSTARSSGASDGGTGLVMEVNIPVTNYTEIIFDGKPVFRDMTGGAGLSGRNHPVSVTAVVEDALGKVITVRCGVNYDCEVARVSEGNYRQRGATMGQGEWVRNFRCLIVEACPTAKRITHLAIVSHGWDYEGYIDNLRVVETTAQTSFDADLAPVAFPDAPPTLSLDFMPKEGPRKELLWTDMPITVAQGDTIYIQASGKMGFFKGQRGNVEDGPDGQGVHPLYQHYFHLPNRPFMALLGMYGLDPMVSDDGRSGSYGPGFIGEGIKSTKRTSGADVLRLGVNDMTGNNSGAYAVKIWQVRDGKVLSREEAARPYPQLPVAGAPALEIVAARYGRGTRYEDVTSKLREHMDQLPRGLNVSAVLGRGPWDRMNPAVEVRYREHGVEKTAIAPGGGILTLGLPAEINSAAPEK